MPPALALTLAGLLAFTSPVAAAEETVALSLEEAEALKTSLIEAKPNLASVALAAFVFPGSVQLQLGHPDRALLLWGSYLTAYTLTHSLIPAQATWGGQKITDWLVLGSFLSVSGVSLADAYGLAQARRQRCDALLNRLTDLTEPLDPEALRPLSRGPNPSQSPASP
ncbi:MAG: hypothetical protein VKP62_07040 [Candidatus Sericytochromatia bacterium]|nr:hypothetical protein [Candidatus Sericytochromatia bacterium]